MNLSRQISFINRREMAKKMIEGIEHYNISVGATNITFSIPAADYFICISAYNEIQDVINPSKEDCLSVLFEDINEIEFYLVKIDEYNKRGGVLKKDYPPELFGEDSISYLKNLDEDSDSPIFFKLDSIDYAVEFISLILQKDPFLFASK